MRSTFTQEADFRQQRDFGQKFSATFEFIGAHWRGLGRALLYIVLPAAILQGIFAGLIQRRFIESGVADAQSHTVGRNPLERLAMLNSLGQSPYYWLSIVLGGVFITLLVLTVYGYMARCLRPTPSDDPIGVGEVWSVVKSQFMSSFFSYFGLVIVVLLGFVLLFVPGLYLVVALSPFFVVKVIENTGFGTTLSRCLRLTKGKWWSTFGLTFVMSLMLGLLVVMVGGALTGLAFGLSGIFSHSDSTSSLGLFTVVSTALGGLFNLLIYPPLLIALAFQYFNLVERHEGVGLRNMVGQLGQAPAPVAAAAYRPDEEGEY
jgi:hypothetical protein